MGGLWAADLLSSLYADGQAQLSDLYNQILASQATLTSKYSMGIGTNHIKKEEPVMSTFEEEVKLMFLKKILDEHNILEPDSSIKELREDANNIADFVHFYSEAVLKYNPKKIPDDAQALNQSHHLFPLTISHG